LADDPIFEPEFKQLIYWKAKNVIKIPRCVTYPNYFSTLDSLYQKAGSMRAYGPETLEHNGDLIWVWEA
jgi:hypothetical protein